MKKNNDPSYLRQKAEDKLQQKAKGKTTQLSEVETLRLIHELDVHQIELEMQNEELLLAKVLADEATAKYCELYDFAPIAFLTVSKVGEIMELNLSAAELLGKNRSQFKNTILSFSLCDNSKSIFYNFLDTVFKSNLKESCNLVIHLENKEPVYVHITGIITENKDYCNLTATDITELMLTKLNLIKAKEKAEESERLKSAFLANMSHEIRTPMNGILGFAELLKKPNLSEDKQQEFIGIIEQSGDRMLNIINDIISISKVESGQMVVSNAPTAINEQLDYIYTFFKPEATKKGIELIVKCIALRQEIVLNTDREKVYAILTNLVKNAIKFTATGSIEFGYNTILTKHPNTIEFFVKDTGDGIREDKQKIIFERFRQGRESLSRNYEGAGLGLAISKAYVEMLGGKIWVESMLGNGSAFYFTLPYNAKHIVTEIVNTNDVYSLPVLIKKLKILIAEDDEVSSSLISEMLDNYCDEFLYTINGIEAIDLIRTNPNIDLILMDVKMPWLDGYLATQQIRGFNKDVIIIAQSAFAQFGDEQRAIDSGCDAYMPKPIDRMQLDKLLVKYFGVK